jgi:hypothetical protein
MGARHLLLVVAGTLGLAGLCGAFLIWPAYREAGEITRRVVELDDKARRLDTQNQIVTELERRLDQAQSHVRESMKEIPDAPDLAALMRKLSLPVDGRHVLDQEFSAGQPGSAIPGDDAAADLMPLTIEMKCTFEAVFALLRAVESMERLIRVSSIQLACKRETPEAVVAESVALPSDDEAPVLSATLGLEAIYEGGIESEVD